MVRYVVFMLLICIKCGSSNLPCPTTTGSAFYVNGKCFRFAQGFRYYRENARKFCLAQGETGRLAEPRTLDEVKFLLANQKEDVSLWIGAHGMDVKKFDSDSTPMEFFNAKFINDTGWEEYGYVVVTRGQFHNNPPEDTRCKAVCEKGVPETYVLPYALVSSLNSTTPVYLEVLPSEITNQTFEVVLELVNGIKLFLDVEHSRRIEINVFRGRQGNDLKSLDDRFLKVTSQYPITLTLLIKSDPDYPLRSLLHPTIQNNVRVPDQEYRSHFVLVSPSYKESFALSVVSMHTGTNEVTITFKDYLYRTEQIFLDSMRIEEPSKISFTLTQYQSANIEGMADLDGTQIQASKDVAVYVIGYAEDVTSFQNNSKTTSNMYQALPSLTSSEAYVTIPVVQQPQGKRDLYKVVSLYPQTTIKVHEEQYHLEVPGVVKMIEVRNDASYYVTGNKPFQIYKKASWIINSTEGPSFYDPMIYSHLTPIIAESMWIRHFQLPLDQTRHKFGLHIVYNRKNIHQFFKLPSPFCSYVRDQSENIRPVVCYLQQESQSEFMSSPDIKAILQEASTFAAYISWMSRDGKYRCQPLGQNWYREWWKEHSPSLQTTIKPATTPQPKPTTAINTAIIRPPTPYPTPTTMFRSSSSLPIKGTSPPIQQTTIKDNEEEVTSGQTLVTLPASTTAATTTRTTTTTPTTTTTTNPAPTTIPQTTTKSTEPPVLNLTLCKQTIVKSLRTNLTEKEIEKEVDKIQRVLHIDTSKISSTVRKKTSAKDARPSSSGLGYAGLSFIIIVFGSIVLADMITLMCQFLEA